MMVKKYLDSKGQTYDVINLDEQPDQRDKVEAISGVKTVPVTVIQTENSEPSVTIGWNPSKLSAALLA